MKPIIYLRCFKGIVLREALRFFHQKERFFSALVRPLVWLGIFAAGFRSVLGVAIIPPYETYIPYEVYIAPGLIAMIQLFNGMQSSLSMVYDREMGSMKTMLVSPIPRWFLHNIEITCWCICFHTSSLCFSNNCVFLGDYTSNYRLFYNFTSVDIYWINVRLVRYVSFLGY